MASWAFIRHAESIANAEGWVAGQVDVGLTPRGLVQARALGKTLRGVRFAAGFVSDAKRARHTALLALADHQLVLRSSPLLRERSLGLWEGRTRAELDAEGAWEVLLKWDGRPPGGESMHDVGRRVLSHLISVDEGVNTVLVAHSTVLRVVTGLLAGMDPRSLGRSGFGNAEVRWLDVAPGDFKRLLKQIG